MSLTTAKSRLWRSKLWHQAVWTWVFNNAGYGLAGPLEGFTDEQILDAHPYDCVLFRQEPDEEENERKTKASA